MTECSRFALWMGSQLKSMIGKQTGMCPDATFKANHEKSVVRFRYRHSIWNTSVL